MIAMDLLTVPILIAIKIRRVSKIAPTEWTMTEMEPSIAWISSAIKIRRVSKIAPTEWTMTGMA